MQNQQWIVMQKSRQDFFKKCFSLMLSKSILQTYISNLFILNPFGADPRQASVTEESISVLNLKT